MTNTLKVILSVLGLIVLLIIALAVYAAVVTPTITVPRPVTTDKLRTCPDEMIINKMPGPKPQSSYYIEDGVRREIEEYDADWVEDNCDVPKQEVY